MIGAVAIAAVISGLFVTVPAGAASLESYSVAERIATSPTGELYVAGSTGPCQYYDRCGRWPLLARFTANGQLDPSFGSGGFVFGQTGAEPVEIMPATSGPVAVVTSRFNGTVVKYTASGALDPSFGSAGSATVPSGLFGRNEARLTGAALYPDGRILVVADASDVSSTRGNWAIGVARFLPDGSLDPSFGTGGAVTIPSPVGSAMYPSRVTLTADGSPRILFQRNAAPGSSISMTGVLALTSMGDVDPAFGGGDGIAPAVSARDFDRILAGDLAVDGSGRILVSASRVGGVKPCPIPVTARLLADGTPDPAFGAAGEAVAVPDAVCWSTPSIEALPDGGSINGLGISLPTEIGALGATRLTSDGGLSSAFGADGLAKVLPRRAAGTFSDMTVQPGGGIVLAGSAGPGVGTSSSCYGEITGPCSAMALSRLTPGGALDTAFGDAGFRLVPDISTCQVERLGVRVRVSKSKLRVRATVRYETLGGAGIRFVVGKGGDFGALADYTIGNLNVRKTGSGTAVFRRSHRLIVWRLRNPGRGLTLLPAEPAGHVARGVCDATVRLRRVKITKQAIFYAGRSQLSP